MPKNIGLKECKKIAKNYDISGKIIEVRGEDIPLIVLGLVKQGKKAIGITGEDLFKEFLLRNKNTKIKILKKIVWIDKNFIFKKPTLCLLGPKNKKLDKLAENLKICINSKYKKLAEKYCLNYFESRGYKLEKIYVSGSTEEFFSNRIVDLVIDIVGSGKSAEKAGLKIYDKIFSSDIVIIGKKPEISLEELYKVVCKRIKNGDKKSYTKKLVENPELLKRKLIEEAAEVITAKNKEEIIKEAADLLYFFLVILAKNKVTIGDIEKENYRRNNERRRK